MNQRLYSFLIGCVIVGMVIGIFGMVQPWSLSLFKPGFLVLPYLTPAYIVLSHITSRDQGSSS